MSKTQKFFALFFLSLIFSACSQPQKKLYYEPIEGTIRRQALGQINQVTWSAPIKEKPLLSNPEFSAKLHEEKKTFNPSLGLPYTSPKASETESKSIYPQYKDFGSLDTSRIPKTIESALKKCLDALKTGTFGNDQTVFSEKSTATVAKYILKDYPECKKWILGEPFISSTTFQVPVYIECEKSHYTISLFLDPKEADKGILKIEQANIGELKNE